MDTATLLASAGVSALVSLLVVGQITVRQARAVRAEASRLAVRDEAAPLIDELARYRFQLRRTSPDRKADVGEMDDHGTVVRIRAGAADLPAWRRWLVDRRCRRVFGSMWTNLAIDFPTKPAEGGESVSAWMALALNHGGVPGSEAEGELGLLHRAYSELPGHPSQEELAAELRRLAASR